MLITPDYAELNRELHRSRPSYGCTAARWIAEIDRFVKSFGCDEPTILDYGCGKGKLLELWQNPHVSIIEYDPGIPEQSVVPTEPVDFVVCIDVLEHVEPLYLDDVLSHIRGLARAGIFLTIATRPARKRLPDGRNAHLIVRPTDEWIDEIQWSFFDCWREIIFAKDLKQEGELLVEIRVNSSRSQ